MRSRAAMVLLLALAGCAPNVSATSDSTSGTPGASSSSGSAGGGGSGGGVGSWTQCSSPEDYAVCQGPHQCVDTPQTGPDTGCHCGTTGDELSLCMNDA